MPQRLVVPFGGSAEPAHWLGRNHLGGKGANLCEMAAIGLPVPPGFVIPTPVCARFYEAGGRLPEALVERLPEGLAHIEQATGFRFGDPDRPLLVSVRSGARVSMPGMMDTVLNLGLNAATVEGLARLTGNRRFAFDSYRRFIQMYADVVLGLDHYLFEDAIELMKDDRGVTLDTELSAADLEELVGRFLTIVEREHGAPFPADPMVQLQGAVAAVFASWRSERATVYRRLNDIPDDWGTAVTVQAMVFGNMGDTSATGVAFTRDPATGERAIYGEYLVNAQGEDVVAGIRTPQYLTRAARERAGAQGLSMEEAMPQVFAELARIFDLLERHYRDMQDIEFTVQEGRLWILQTRSGKRTGRAALRIACEMVAEGLITEKEAIRRVDPAVLDQLLHPTLDPAAPREVIATGLPASPGAASGAIVLDSTEAERRAALGESVILVRHETSPEDIAGMHAAAGILTARGGMTSHAAVVARGMGRPCVTGAGSVRIDLAARQVTVGTHVLPEGTILTIDGGTGEVMLGEVPKVEPELSGHFATLMGWADRYRRLAVRANAETPTDCRVARQFGAEGVGLARTEHMFFEADRIVLVRRMILAQDPAERAAALAALLPLQRADFGQIFEVMAGLPVTIRLLDPPLHEFLPRHDADFTELAEASGLSVSTLRRRADELAEVNPMLGHRGCRLGITFPEIYAMQVRAILEAALAQPDPPIPEIMIPLVATARELEITRGIVDQTAEAVFAEAGRRLPYLVGTMIELPRAALRAGEIARHAQFFSFGTNDLTQTTLGISRDDAARFLPAYVEKGIYPKDPFVTLDVEGVGELVRLAAERGRAARADLKLGICGEHGGDPASIAFVAGLGLDYVSCSPWRVPIARLAAAQAALAGDD
ncbi:MAG: pyruvate, phosphate dikinase [Sphingomonadaceae bacterium]|uniref:pyruvate, phosphate dikinase n=1 Tax=Thermaurantiacus sp. TaxID=2820283 RepID=UPI00298F3A00|nr:pyruvate, phosphate dikinase [Thermaurantiacus sp.]MCS6987868.1 pyruvate, phosphate dikinase [Sphingomonadaceae bacterium]MDW8414912.1 pyruvate, phosphate dikinase [Thermaurantiacus sp.]